MLHKKQQLASCGTAGLAWGTSCWNIFLPEKLSNVTLMLVWSFVKCHLQELLWNYADSGTNCIMWMSWGCDQEDPVCNKMWQTFLEEVETLVPQYLSQYMILLCFWTVTSSTSLNECFRVNVTETHQDFYKNSNYSSPLFIIKFGDLLQKYHPLEFGPQHSFLP